MDPTPLNVMTQRPENPMVYHNGADLSGISDGNMVRIPQGKVAVFEMSAEEKNKKLAEAKTRWIGEKICVRDTYGQTRFGFVTNICDITPLMANIYVFSRDGRQPEQMTRVQHGNENNMWDEYVTTSERMRDSIVIDLNDRIAVLEEKLAKMQQPSKESMSPVRSQK